MHFCSAITLFFLPSARFLKWGGVPFEPTGGTLGSAEFASAHFANLLGVKLQIEICAGKWVELYLSDCQPVRSEKCGEQREQHLEANNFCCYAKDNCILKRKLNFFIFDYLEWKTFWCSCVPGWPPGPWRPIYGVNFTCKQIKHRTISSGDEKGWKLRQMGPFYAISSNQAQERGQLLKGFTR